MEKKRESQYLTATKRYSNRSQDYQEVLSAPDSLDAEDSMTSMKGDEFRIDLYSQKGKKYRIETNESFGLLISSLVVSLLLVVLLNTFFDINCHIDFKKNNCSLLYPTLQCLKLVECYADDSINYFQIHTNCLILIISSLIVYFLTKKVLLLPKDPKFELKSVEKIKKNRNR